MRRVNYSWKHSARFRQESLLAHPTWDALAQDSSASVSTVTKNIDMHHMASLSVLKEKTVSLIIFMSTNYSKWDFCFPDELRKQLNDPREFYKATWK